MRSPPAVIALHVARRRTTPRSHGGRTHNEIAWIGQETAPAVPAKGLQQSTFSTALASTPPDPARHRDVPAHIPIR